MLSNFVFTVANLLFFCSYGFVPAANLIMPTIIFLFLQESAKRIRLLNSSSKDNTTAVYGINQFSHLFPEEFRGTFSGCF